MKINVGLYGGFKGNDRNRAEIINCDKCNECSLYKKGMCINVTIPFGKRCKIGKVNIIDGYTKRAKARRDFDLKYKSDEKYAALKHPDCWYLETVGDTVLINLIYAIVEKRMWSLNEWIDTKDYHINDCGFLVGEVSVIDKKDLTPELIKKIVSYPAKSMMGNPISRYFENIIPNMLHEMKEKLPEIYGDFLEKYPEYKEISPNYVGRKAKIISVKNGTEIKTNKGIFRKTGNKLICENYKGAFLPFDANNAKIEIQIDKNMTFEITDNSQVDENTIFD